MAEDARAAEPSPPPPAAPDFRWQAFFQRSRDPLFLLNRQRRLLFVNQAWEELTGLPAGQVRGLACTRRAPAAPLPSDEVTRALGPPADVLRGHSARVRRCLPAPGGGRQCWDIEFVPFRDEQGTLAVLGKITPVAGGDAVCGGLPDKVVALRAALAGRYTLDSLGGGTPAQRRLAEQTRLAAASRAAVLLVGEPGAGKHWLARTIHGLGATREQAFAALDCGKLPEPALAAALFGDAGLIRRPGIGTLYLREPAALPCDLQARLAELLADPGEAGPRVIAGCPADPAKEARADRLLEDLHCALGTLVLELPPLRRRLAELPWLVERLLEQVAAADGRPVPALTPAAWESLRAYPWPGNLRELRAALTSARAHAAADTVDVADLPGPVRLAVQLGQEPGPRGERALPLAPLLEQVERRLIQLALGRAQGNKSRAAELLGLPRPRLLRRMEALGLIEKGEG
jgi:transcriptional regulator with PAS, ATPase and Fis domain